MRHVMPVEADSLGYKINNTLVSDFVYPSFFGQRPNNPGVSANQLDFGTHLNVNIPTALAQGDITNAIAGGGYLAFWTPTSGWNQVVGKERAGDYFAVAAPPGSRRERRMSTRDFMPSLEHKDIQKNRHSLNERLLELYPAS